MLPYRPGKLRSHIPVRGPPRLGVVCARSALRSSILTTSCPPNLHLGLGADAVCAPAVKHLAEPERRTIITAVIDEFEGSVLPRSNELQCVIRRHQ